MSNKTHFGYKQVDKNDKEKLVRDVFSSVATKYDIMNDAMSLGVHRCWKNSFVNGIKLNDDTKIIDVAGGTGDIAFRLHKKNNNSQITVCDINLQMLNEGKNRAIDLNILNKLDWVCANAENLPFPDDHFDYYTIAFGIRNVTNIDNALEQAYRVLKPGGKFMCLEFSHVNNELFDKFYNFYSFKIIPFIGKQIAKDEDSYRYLVESIRKFPNQNEFSKKIENANFSNVKYRNLTNGIVAIHSGWKI